MRRPSGEWGARMRKEMTHTDKVPSARAPLSQAIAAGDCIFASGRPGNDPKTKRPAEGKTAADTRQVCGNLKAVLRARGSSSENAVKVTIHMVDLNQLMPNEGFSQYLSADPPRRNRRVGLEAIAMASRACPK